ncbi:hypothetical protein QZQ41_18135 [Serratia marcescens]|uniref:hypothetical protein n=1 Tax=Serratia marcescens TaxID=615 RepID=UPI000D73415C|nr:hypothetical protein [Serratia marcescens]AWQ48416.1 hypothetical protein B1A42_14180 [Serratia marcescens]MDP8616454.1 hypothetical protein [Serratia marcescens]MDP8646581.1 hypothetical protein [Serratia marcescens]MDP8656507.1 hypothetical protein [Serratia marcescens]MDP8661491.1 hypothetical protein [Serratia marcescens]
MSIKFKKVIQADVSANGIIIGQNEQVVDVVLNIVEVSVNQYHGGRAFCEVSFNDSKDKESRVIDFNYAVAGGDVFEQAESHILSLEGYEGGERVRSSTDD